MQLALQSPIRKILLLGACLLLSILYVFFCSRGFLASYWSQQPRIADLEKAIAMEPGNAAYRYMAGRYYLLVDQNPVAALPFFESSVALNPHAAASWFDLSTADQLLGNTNGEESAIAHAIAADPTTPEIAWKAANLYWVEGKPEKALAEFRVVMENDPELAGQAIQRAWRIRPDVDWLLQNVMPRRADLYSAFLELLISDKQASAAAKLWDHLAKLAQPVEPRYLFEYVRYLVDQQDVAQAHRVWSDAANLADLAAYQPSSSNLVINGDFSLPILNGGFDWLYQEIPGVSLGLDPTESHSGHRSLSVVFDSTGLADAGIQQLVPVDPNTTYQFSAYYKSESIEGAGAPRLVVEDRFSGKTYFTSDELKGADFWSQVAGTVTTDGNAKLLMIHLARIPAGNAIRGRLWIDDVQMTVKDSTEGGE
jgi:hypothetical protein